MGNVLEDGVITARLAPRTAVSTVMAYTQRDRLRSAGDTFLAYRATVLTSDPTPRRTIDPPSNGSRPVQ